MDGWPVDGPGVEYDRGEAPLVPTEEDLSPARIAVRNASVSVSDLVLKRDIYYTQSPGDIDYGTVFGRQSPRNPTQLLDFLADASHFPSFSEIDFHDFKLGEDRFLMLGDNSPQSKDSRGWDSSDRGLGHRLQPRDLGGAAQPADGEGVLRLLAARSAVLAGIEVE